MYFLWLKNIIYWIVFPRERQRDSLSGFSDKTVVSNTPVYFLCPICWSTSDVEIQCLPNFKGCVENEGLPLGRELC